MTLDGVLHVGVDQAAGESESFAAKVSQLNSGLKLMGNAIQATGGAALQLADQTIKLTVQGGLGVDYAYAAALAPEKTFSLANGIQINISDPAFGEHLMAAVKAEMTKAVDDEMAKIEYEILNGTGDAEQAPVGLLTPQVGPANFQADGYTFRYMSPFSFPPPQPPARPAPWPTMYAALEFEDEASA